MRDERTGCLAACNGKRVKSKYWYCVLPVCLLGLLVCETDRGSCWLICAVEVWRSKGLDDAALLLAVGERKIKHGRERCCCRALPGVRKRREC